MKVDPTISTILNLTHSATPSINRTLILTPASKSSLSEIQLAGKFELVQPHAFSRLNRAHQAVFFYVGLLPPDWCYCSISERNADV